MREQKTIYEFLDNALDPVIHLKDMINAAANCDTEFSAASVFSVFDTILKQYQDELKKRVTWIDEQLGHRAVITNGNECSSANWELIAPGKGDIEKCTCVVVES